MRRFTRLTNGFSKPLAHHDAALGLFFLNYNFCQRHGTLKTTPAVSSGLTEKPWTVAEMIERTANYVKPEAPKLTFAQAIESLNLPDDSGSTNTYSRITETCYTGQVLHSRATICATSMIGNLVDSISAKDPRGGTCCRRWCGERVAKGGGQDAWSMHKMHKLHSDDLSQTIVSK